MKDEYDVHKSDRSATMAIRQILVPTDLSPMADDALEYALEIARQTGAGVEVMTVLGQLQGDTFSPIRYSPEAFARHETAEGLIRQSLGDLVERHDTAGLRVTTSIRKGQPLHAVLACVRQMRADLLVVGAHDRGVIHHFLVRSMAGELVRRAPASVLVVDETMVAGASDRSGSAAREAT